MCNIYLDLCHHQLGCDYGDDDDDDDVSVQVRAVQLNL